MAETPMYTGSGPVDTGAAFSFIGGGGGNVNAGQPVVNAYAYNTNGEVAMQIPGMSKDLYLRNPQIAPLLRCLEMLGSADEGWEDVWKWKEDIRLNEVDALAGSLSSVGTTLTVSNGGRFTPRDTILVNFQYHAHVTSIAGNVLTVAWYPGETPPAGLPSSAPVILIGTSYFQNDIPNLGPIVRTTEIWNGWQTQVTALGYTLDFKNGNYWFGDQAAYQVRKKDEEHDTKREKTLLMGQRSIDYTTGDSPLSTLRGLWFWAGVVSEMNGNAPTRSDLDDFVQAWCTGNIEDNEKRVCLCSLNVKRHVGEVFYPYTLFGQQQTTKLWGLDVTTYTVAGKEISFVHDPLFDLEGWHDKLLGFVVSPNVIVRRNKRGGAKKFANFMLPHGEDLFHQESGYINTETLEVKWAYKHVRAMEGIEVTAAALL